VTRTADSGLVEVSPPRRASRRSAWSTKQVAAAAHQVLNVPGQWFSDGKGYTTRRQAYHKADALVRAIHDLSTEPALHLQRKTQLDPETLKFRWAIRSRLEEE
jgi:hypothetical protein